MERLAYAITDYLLRREVIKEAEYDIYAYGYSVFLEQMLQVIGFFVLAFVTGNIGYTVVFLSTFYLLRSSFGGYHAETSICCMVVSYGGWAAVMISANRMQMWQTVPIWLWGVLVLDLVIFILIGPVAHANKPLTAMQKSRNKRKGLLLFWICTLFAFLGRTCVGVDTVYIGTVTFVAVLTVVGKRKEGTKYEEN